MVKTKWTKHQDDISEHASNVSYTYVSCLLIDAAMNFHFLYIKPRFESAPTKLIDIRRLLSSAIWRYLVGQKFSDVSEIRTPCSGPKSMLKKSERNRRLSP